MVTGFWRVYTGRRWGRIQRCEKSTLGRRILGVHGEKMRTSTGIWKVYTGGASQQMWKQAADSILLPPHFPT